VAGAIDVTLWGIRSSGEASVSAAADTGGCDALAKRGGGSGNRGEEGRVLVPAPRTGGGGGVVRPVRLGGGGGKLRGCGASVISPVAGAGVGRGGSVTVTAALASELPSPGPWSSLAAPAAGGAAVSGASVAG